MAGQAIERRGFPAAGADERVRPLPPVHPVIALVAASLDILGGQGVQAAALAASLRAEGAEVTFIPIDPRFPSALRWLRRWPYARKILHQTLSLPSRARLRRADGAQTLSSSYGSIRLAPAPAIRSAWALR